MGELRNHATRRSGSRVFRTSLETRSEVEKKKQSSYYESVDGFCSVLKKITEENGYLLELVFVPDKSGVMWKWIPVHMFIQKIEKFDFEFKVAKNHIALLFCCSATGDICRHLLTFIDQ